MTTNQQDQVVPEKLRRPYRRICVETAVFVAQYAGGESLRTIATTADVSVKVVRKRLLEAGVALRTKWSVSKSPGRGVLAHMYLDARLSIREMANQLGADATTVRTWLAKSGIPRRSISEAKRGQGPTPEAVRASITARRKYFVPGKAMVGYKVDCYGYVLIWNHALQRYEKEHRLVLSKKLGRPLLPTEDAHHINGIRQDNRPENLELMVSRSAHQREHSKTRRRTRAGRFA